MLLFFYFILAENYVNGNKQFTKSRIIVSVGVDIVMGKEYINRYKSYKCTRN